MRRTARASRAKARPGRSIRSPTTINGSTPTAAGATSRSSRRSAIASGTIDIGADAPAKFSGRVGWGAHRLDIKTLDGEETSVAFDVGWSGTASADTPDNVVVTLDKTNYAAGEQAKLRIASAFAGKATIALVGDTDRALHRRRSCRRRQCRSVRDRVRLGARRLCRRADPSPARCRGQAHARPRDRRRLVRHRSRRAHARCRARRAAARAAAPIDDAAHSSRRPCAGRGGAGDRLGGRCRHSQPDRIQDA